jgi:hypothetical protein
MSVQWNADERSRERRLLGALAVICGLLITGGVAMPTLTGENGIPPALNLGDVSEAHIVEIRDRRGETVASGEFRSRVDTLGNTEKDAALTDRRGRAVVGEVELEIPAPQRPDRRPELEVDIIGLPARATFSIAIDDRVVATFDTDDRGSVDMELQEGEIPARIPEVGLSPVHPRIGTLQGIEPRRGHEG